MKSLRERNRHNAMRTTQRAALDLFETRGFEAVTVAEIAEAVGMAASTLYRHFDTKEAILLWDEHDGSFDAAFERELTSRPPLEALRTIFVEELGSRYDDDLEFQLRRIRYVYATEAVHAAALERNYADAAELTAALEYVLAEKNRTHAPLLAGAALVAVDIAFDRWQAAEGATSLGELIDDAFSALGDLASLR